MGTAAGGSAITENRYTERYTSPYGMQHTESSSKRYNIVVASYQLSHFSSHFIRFILVITQINDQCTKKTNWKLDACICIFHMTVTTYMLTIQLTIHWLHTSETNLQTLCYSAKQHVHNSWSYSLLTIKVQCKNVYARQVCIVREPLTSKIMLQLCKVIKRE